MRRFCMALVLAVSLAGLAAAAASASGGPRAVHGSYHASGSLADAQMPCSAPVALSYEQWWTFTDVTLKDGRIREVGSWTEHDTFTANGKTLVSDRYEVHYTAVVSDPSWTTVYSQVWSGKIFSATLPDGTRLVTVGIVDVVNKPMPVWTVDAGRNMDFIAFCGYFFP
jgi:hypothetical protein